jgi:hypothetical protein
MAAVIAAIAGVILTGGVAIWRERRIALGDLLVAARVVSVALFNAGVPVGSMTSLEYDPSWLKAVPEVADFSLVWVEHRNTLARHLRRDQWEVVQSASRMLSLALFDEGEGVSRDRQIYATAENAMRAAFMVLDDYVGATGWIRNPGRRAELPPGGANSNSVSGEPVEE